MEFSYFLPSTPTTYPMKLPVVIIATLALLAHSLLAADQTISYPEDDPVFSITFPENWNVEDGESVSASSEDELVHMELISLEAEALGDAVKLAKESLKEQFEGLKWNGEAEKGELNGMPVSFINANVTIEEIKMAINCAIFAPKDSDTFFMLFNVVSLESLEQHSEAIAGIINSVKGK